MFNLPEIIVILIVLVIVFGMGKLGDIGKAVARLRLQFNKGLHENYIDITAHQSGKGAAVNRSGSVSGPRPGTAPQPVEDAHIETSPSDINENK